MRSHDMGIKQDLDPRLASRPPQPSHFYPLNRLQMMSSPPDWDRFTNEMGVSLTTEARICCGTTKAGAPCKNSIKFQDIKTGQQQLANLAAQPFDFLTLRPTLCDIARNFLCARWHRQRQADQLGQQWYEVVVRSREHTRHTSAVAAVAPDIEAD
jgi:hypothetical protein